MNICLFGAASALIDTNYMKAVEELGEMMAKKGHTMIYGAGATGLMGAAARGMSKVHGRQIVGIAPRFFPVQAVQRNDLHRHHAGTQKSHGRKGRCLYHGSRRYRYL